MKNLVLKHSTVEQFNTCVLQVNKFTTHAYFFLKLLMLYFFENEHFSCFPIFNKEYICNIFRVIGTRKSKAGHPVTGKNLNRHKTITWFHQNHYKALIPSKEVLAYDYLSRILAYSAIEMITNINNNIFMHFEAHFTKFMKAYLNYKDEKAQIYKLYRDKERKEKLNLFNKRFFLICNDVLHYTERILSSDQKDVQIILHLRLCLFGNILSSSSVTNLFREVEATRIENGKKVTRMEKRTFKFYVKEDKNKNKYLYSFIKLGKMYEEFNFLQDKEGKPEKKLRLFNILPLQTSVVPNHICIDNSGLVNYFFNKDEDEKEDDEIVDEEDDNSKSSALANMKNKVPIWEQVFDLKRKEFKKNGHEFNFMLKTDGVSCSVVFEAIKSSQSFIKSQQMSSVVENMPYIEKILVTEVNDQKFHSSVYEKLKNKTPVCVDPGTQDIIHAGAYINGKFVSLRYTADQRRFETKRKKYQRTRERIKSAYIQYVENRLAQFNSKVNSFVEFVKYVKIKNEANMILRQNYEKKIYRQLNFYAYINMQKSEAKLMNEFRKKFGGPETAHVCIGDWSKGDFNAPGHESIINKKIRKLIVKAGYNTSLINEYRTSITCNECGGELEKFHTKTKTNKRGESKKILCHGLLRCYSSIEPCCLKIHNRDKNAVKNMLAIVDHLFECGERLDEFSRKKIAERKALKEQLKNRHELYMTPYVAQEARTICQVIHRVSQFVV